MISSVGSSSYFTQASSTSQIAQKLFKKLDTNEDGGIDETELEAIAGVDSSTDISQVFTKMDTNGDGKIDEDENESALQKVADKMSSVFQNMQGMNGQMPPPPPPQNSDEMFDSLDTNADGGIDKDEFSAISQNEDGQGPQFSDIDTNGDGVIDKTENSDAMEKMSTPPPPPSGNMSESDLSGTQTVSNTSKTDFSDLLSALQTTLDESDENEDNSSIQQLFNELKNNVKYSSQGSLSYSSYGVNSLFNLSA